jgi:hypothetical protein
LDEVVVGVIGLARHLIHRLLPLLESVTLGRFCFVLDEVVAQVAGLSYELEEEDRGGSQYVVGIQKIGIMGFVTYWLLIDLGIMEGNVVLSTVFEDVLNVCCVASRDGWAMFLSGRAGLFPSRVFECLG